MGEYFSMNKEDSDYAINFFNDVLEEWGKPCSLVYKSTEVLCPNCIVNPRTGESTNRYKPGGPEEFSAGEICPVCEGRGRIMGTANMSIIKMVIDWTPKTWINVGSEVVRIPAGLVATRGYSSDLASVLRADYVLLDTTNPYLINSYKLHKQPHTSGPITQAKYFLAVWEKTG